MVEYTDPNPFKPFHIGHLMSNAIGESIARLQEFSGAEVIRANYQGDIGLHVAKTMYCLLRKPEEYIRKDESIGEQAFLIGVAYSEGAEAYESDEKAKEEINEINKKLYEKSDKKINELYDWGRDVTLKAFEEIYKDLGTQFKHYFFESVMAPIGESIVRDNLGKVFEESDGAVVFKAEKHDPKLHTRVFINSKGLPTYETKEIYLS
jgi:arginyl-tRNA synthetase